MKYTLEFKLECIRKYKAGERIDDPGGCSHKTFRDTVLQWVRIYDAMGEIGLEHKKPKRTWQDKLGMIERVSNGGIHQISRPFQRHKGQPSLRVVRNIPRIRRRRVKIG